jgi:radical SAM superfamily enzyme YgiQ (UPF0313 family)
MNVLLIKPPLNKISVLGDSLIEPLELEILAATIPEHQCRILDMRIDKDLEGTLLEFQPDVVGLTAYTTEVPVVQSLLQEVKRFHPDSFTIVGGCHASVMPNDFFGPHLDAVAVGSGEQLFPDLVAHLSRQQDISEIRSLWIRRCDRFIYTGNGLPLKNLHALPEPKRDLTRDYRHRYFFGSSRPAAALITSRGCPFRCSFCSIWRSMHGKYLTRDPVRVAEELGGINESHVFIADDNTLTHANHAEALYMAIRDGGVQKHYKMYGRADAIVARPDLIEKWRAIGLKSVIMGLESFQDQRLESFHKKSSVALQNQAMRILKAHDVKVRAYFIVDPDFSSGDFEELLDYVHKEEINEPMFTVLTPLPGTDYYDEVHDKMVLDQHEFFDLAHALLPTRLPRKDFYRKFSRLYRECYPLKRAFRNKPGSSRVNDLIGGFVSYFKVRSVTRKMQYAYKMEEQCYAEACTDQSRCHS